MSEAMRTVREQVVVYEREREVEVPLGPLRGSRDAARILFDIIPDGPREHFVALALDARFRPVGWSLIAIGTVSECHVPAQEVFRFALVSGARALVLGHNHPSGDPEPSREDLALTDRLVRTGEMLDVQVLDHVIVAHRTGSMVSLLDRDLMRAD